MIYTYRFADGTTNESKVTDKIAAELKELDRIEYNNNQAETRRHASLEAFNLDDGLFPADTDIEADYEFKECQTEIVSILSKLEPEQQKLIKQIFFEDIQPSEIAKWEGVGKSAISHRIERALKK